MDQLHDGYKILRERRRMQECEKVVTNIARVLALCKADVPYYVGCNRPMLGQSLPATFCESLSLELAIHQRTLHSLGLHFQMMCRKLTCFVESSFHWNALLCDAGEVQVSQTVLP